MDQEKNIRILILEDSATDAELMGFELRKAGIAFKTERVETRETFIKALNEFKPDLILSDYKLPEFDGAAALKLVQQSHPEIPVIMVTGALADIKAVDFIKMGAKDYVLKDRMSRLGAAVMQALSSEQDVHLRQEAEKAVQVSEMHYQAIMDGANDAIICVNSQGIIYLWNRKAEMLFGYSAEEAMGQDMHQLIVPERAIEGLRQYAKKIEGTAQGKTLEITARHRNKSEFPVDLSISPMLIDGHWHASAIIRDITERKQNEEKRRQLSTIIEATPDLVGIVDAKSTLFHYINDAGRKLMGIGKDEDISRLKITDFYSESMNQKLYNKIIPAVIRNGNWSGEVSFLNKENGQNFPATMVVMSHKSDSGEIELLSTICHDISARNRSINALHQFENIVASSSDMLALIDNKFVYKAANTAYLNASAKTHSDVIGHKVIEVLGEEFFNKVVRTNAIRCLAGEQINYQAWLKFQGYEDPRYMEINYYPFSDKDGEIIGFVVNGRNITDQYSATVALQQSQNQLMLSLEGTIDAIAKVVEMRDPYTAGHQRRVACIATAIAEELGLGKEVIKGIHLGATIHDIGKIKLPAEILTKPTQLSAAEYMLIQSHAEVGYEILKDIKFPWPVADIAYQHHERMDGSGYPLGLKGNEISLEARIVMVADVFEAISSVRPYRMGLGEDIAAAEIKHNRGSHYDPDVVDAFLKVLAAKKIKNESFSSC